MARSRRTSDRSSRNSLLDGSINAFSQPTIRVLQTMKRRLLLTAALLLTTLVNSTYAQQQVGPSALFGKWTATEQHPSGATLTSLVQFTDDKQFTTSTTVNGKPFMKASGSW